MSPFIAEQWAPGIRDPLFSSISFLLLVLIHSPTLQCTMQTVERLPLGRSALLCDLGETKRAQWQSPVSPWHHTERSQKADPSIANITQRESSIVHTTHFPFMLDWVERELLVCGERSARGSGKAKGGQRWTNESMTSTTGLMVAWVQIKGPEVPHLVETLVLPTQVETVEP